MLVPDYNFFSSVSLNQKLKYQQYKMKQTQTTDLLTSSVISALPKDALSSINRINQQILKNSLPVARQKIEVMEQQIKSLELSNSPTVELEIRLAEMKEIEKQIWVQLEN